MYPNPFLQVFGGGTSVALPVSVANGGTGATDAATARTNLGAASSASPTFTGVVNQSGASYVLGGDWVLAQSAVPFIHISSGSIGNNGALTGVTALPRTFSGGAWVYYPTNSISASTPAGWYWTVFSSTTAGTIYNSTYTSGIPGIGTTTAFATTGPGAFTGDTTQRNGPSITLAANTMGAMGLMYGTFAANANNTGGAKTVKVLFGALTPASIGITTGFGRGEFEVANIGLTNAQIGNARYNVYGSGAGVFTTLVAGAVDTTADVTVALSLTKAVATDNAVLESFSLVVRRVS